MKIQKQNLLEALEKVKPGLANKEIIEQSTSFAFMGNKVVTYNDEISISHPVEELDVTAAVKAQELYQFLNKIKKNEIDISWEENQVVITAGRSKAGLILQQEVKLPVEEIGEIGKWKKIPDDLLDALKFCRSNCSKDMSRPILTCVHVRKDGVLEASDSFRIVKYSLTGKMPVDSFLIPATSVQELIKYPISHIATGNGWIHFKSEDGTIFSCRVFNDTYPNIEHIMDFDGKEINLPRTLQEALDRAQIFSKADFDMDSLVEININGGKIKVTAEADFGWFEETARIKYKGDIISFKTNPGFLIDMLDQVQTCLYGEDKIKFSAANWEHVIALTG